MGKSKHAFLPDSPKTFLSAHVCANLRGDMMNSTHKDPTSIARRIARRCYSTFAQSAPVRWVVRRELAALGATSWQAAIIDGFIREPHGAAYGLTRQDRESLVSRFMGNVGAMQSGTAPIVHVVLAQALLNVPPDVAGVAVECGAWKGASSCALSLVCERIGRRLLVCDSFQGLPDDGAKRHIGIHSGIYGHYREGMFCGALDEVRENIRQHGALSVCDFVPGFFSASLQALRDPVVFAFLDVDLEGSTRDCLKHLWPLLAEGCSIYCDDAADLEVVKVYFDSAWWRDNLQTDAPGLVGSGCGLPLSPTFSTLGYMRKITRFDEKEWARAPFLDYPAE
jgi:hypothetical protein